MEYLLTTKTASLTALRDPKRAIDNAGDVVGIHESVINSNEIQ
jgi:hypothetical protein